MQCAVCTSTPNSKGVQREKIPGDGDTLAKVMLESVTLSSGKAKPSPRAHTRTHACTSTHTHAHTHTQTHSPVKISTNPVYYLPPLCTLPLFFILSLSHFLPRSPLLLFSLSLLLKPILVAAGRAHTRIHCQFTPVMFVGLGLRRGNREGSVDVRCSFPAPALFTSCRENYLPFVCVKGLLPLPSVQRIQWQACVHAHPRMCMCVCVRASVRLFSNLLK